MKRILIIDDSNTARMIVRRCLEIVARGEVEFLEAADGKEALKKLRKRPVDLIITDLNMPVMDGETLLKWIKRSPKTNDIPVVVISSAGNPAKNQQVLDLGALTVISKPISPEAINETMGSFLEAWEENGTSGRWG